MDCYQEQALGLLFLNEAYMNKKEDFAYQQENIF
jgi:hypothetical protein